MSISARDLGDDVPDPIDWDNEEHVRILGWLVRQKCPEGLSALGRHVLEYDYFEIGAAGARKRHYRIGWGWRRGRWHTCGLVHWGPHREMAKALCSSGDVLLLCSRMSMKTHWSITSDIQAICLDRNIRILEFMETKDQAADSIAVIAEHLEHNEKLHRLFKTFKEKGSKWTALRLTVSNRTLVLRDPTVVGHGADSRSTGSRNNRFHVDDPICDDTARNPELIAKANRKFRSLQPLVAPGGQTIINMTSYHPDDLSFVIRGDPNMGFRVVEIPCGVEAKVDEEGVIQVEGWPRFPHMGKHFLLDKARKMGVEQFNLNYALQLTTEGQSHFHREDFPVESWDERFRMQNAYLMTDLAGTEDLNACMCVLSIVCVDADDVAYVIDADGGFWNPGTVQDKFLSLFAMWCSRLRIQGIVMETTLANRIYRNQIEKEMQRRNQFARWILVPRVTNDSKDARIIGSQQRIASRRLRFVDTCRREWTAIHERRVLFNPQAITTPEGNPLPGGEIIDQYLKFRRGYKGLVDFPDMFAELDTTKSNGERYVLPSQRTMHVEDGDDVLTRRLNNLKHRGRQQHPTIESFDRQPLQDDSRPIWERIG